MIQTKLFRFLMLSTILSLSSACATMNAPQESSSSTSFAEAAAAPVLPSWKDGATKQAIIDFVTKVTDPASQDFIPVPERIATIDNDGTLWSEKPTYFQVFFTVDRVKQMAPQHPEWKTKEPFASILKGDLNKAFAGGDKAIIEALMATHTGMSTAEFESLVSNWITTARHPTTNKLFTEMVFQPMLELLDYLRANDFKTFIVSGGGIEFMRPWTERVYGIPPEQVVGSSVKTKFQVGKNGPELMRLPEVSLIDDKEGKPVGIHSHIGRRPVMAFGNSDGDFQMLQWTTSAEGPRFGALVHHTDAEREYAYNEGTEKAIKEAGNNGWVVIDMKQDWKVIYPE